MFPVSAIASRGCSPEDSGLPVTRAASANQIVTNNISRKKARKVAAMFASQAKACQQNERLVDLEQNLQNK